MRKATAPVVWVILAVGSWAQRRAPAKPQGGALLARLPLCFVENRGVYPEACQELAAARQPVAVAFAVAADGEGEAVAVGFRVGACDLTRVLVLAVSVAITS